MLKDATRTLEFRANLFTAPEPNPEEAFRQKLATMIAGGHSAQTMSIDPMMAKVMLERNTGNRVLSKARAARWAKDMKEGKWKLTGEPVIFSIEGILNDGQTRLQACVQAGCPFLTDVRFGIERAAFAVTGSGAKRSLADVFHIAGEQNTTKLAAALNLYAHYCEGMTSGNYRLSQQDGVALLEANPDIRKSMVPAMQLYSATHFLPPSYAVFLHYIFALKDADKADDFFKVVETGLGLSDKNDPRYRLRERLLANVTTKGKVSELELAAITIKAWNVWRRGRSTQSLRWITNPAEGKSAEPFPEAI